jgi:hypothetical protein
VVSLTRLIAALALAAAGAAHAQSRPLVENLRGHVLPLWEKMDAGGAGSLVIVGDSMSFRQDSYNWFLRDRLWDRFGNAGDGYLGLAMGFGYGSGNGPRPGIWRRADASTDTVVAGVNSVRNPDGYWAPDGLYTRIRNLGWFEADFYGPQAQLH